MIEEIFNMAEIIECAANRSMHRWHAVGGERNVKRFTKSRDLKKAGYPGATRDVRLQDVHGFRLQHGTKITEIIAVFPRRDIHACWRALAHKSQACEIVGRDGLLEPGHAQVLKAFGTGQGLFSAIRAVGINK